jgi:PKD domain-containing protein/beta-propeller repeat-containing protein/all-beta uncharacterized protein/S-layer family protein
MKRANIYLVHLLCLTLIITGFISRQAEPATWRNPHSSGAGGPDAAPQDGLSKLSTLELAGLTNSNARSHASTAFNQQPLRFEANLGQTDPQVKFLARGLGFSLFLTSTEAVLSLRKDEGEEAEDKKMSPASSAILQRPSRRASQTSLRMKLLGADRAASVSGQGQLAARTNYFIGQDRKQWRTNVPTYTSVRYSEVYPGIDLIYYGNGQQLEYDFVIAPGASPQAIALSFAGAEQITVDAGGDLVLRTAAGEVRQQKPVIYQDRDGKRQSVTGGYVLKNGEEIGFEVGPHDASLPLVIDPIISYQVIGGLRGDEIGYGIATDRDGNIYVTGFTNSTDFPVTPGAFQSTLGSPILPFPPPVPQGGDAFVAKLDSSGNILYATYLGSSNTFSVEMGQGIAVDEAGNAYVAGRASNGFPVFNGMNSANGGIFLAKFNPNGGVIFSSRINAGGSFTSFPGSFFLNVGLGLDSQGNTYLTGQNYVIKVNPSGTSLVYNTSLFADVSPQSITADAAGNAYVTGHSDVAGGRNIFVKKFNPSGAELYSRAFGGIGDGTFDFEYGRSIAADSNGNAYVTGITNSSDFPTMNAFQSVYGGSSTDGGDAFLVKLDTNGNTLFSTYLGGQGFDSGFGVATDLAGNAYVTGTTRSTNFPVKDAFQQAPNNPPAEEIFITKFYPDGMVDFSSYYGSQFTENGYAIAVDPFGGDIYITGDTASGENGGGFDIITHAAFVVKIESGDTDGDSLLDTWEQQGVTVDGAGNVSVGNTGNGEFIDLPAMGSDPLHKDIFVHADWMDPLRPHDSAIRRVVEAFDKAPVMNPDRRWGIHLHVDLGPNSLMDNVKKLTWGTRSKAGLVPFAFEIGSYDMETKDFHFNPQVDFYKDVRFGPARRARVFRYCLFANKLTGLLNSGIARGAPATDFLVTLGFGVVPTVGGTRLQQAGTFMHELGHTLGLDHGGGDEIGYKPNYLSVMNYHFQFDGLFRNDDSRELNYSVRRLPTLDEAALGEAVGIRDPDNHDTFWLFPPTSPCASNPDYYYSLPYPALDWNCSNSLTAGTVNLNLRFDPDFPNSPPIKLEGFADWANLRYDGGGRIGQLGAVPPNPMTTINNEVDVNTLLNLKPPALRDAENRAPIDDVTYAPLGGDFPLDVTFDGSASTDSDGGTIVSYAWDFGDGSTATGAVVSHTYTQPGLYYATLKVTDNEGNINLVPLQNRVEVNCTFAINPTAQSFPVVGGNQSVNVITQGECFWKAASNDNWIKIISGHSGEGNGPVSYRVEANPTTASRTGTLRIAGQTITIEQEGIVCAYTLTPTTFNFGGSGGTGDVAVEVDNACEFLAVSNDDWITIDGGNSPTRVTNPSSGGFSFTVAANTTSSSRTGTLTVAGQTVTVHQSGPTADCSFTLSPATLTLPANGSSGSFLVQTLDGCSWTATPGADWISLSFGLSGTGLGAVSYEIAPNPDPTPRSATITVADKIFTVRQGGKFNDVPVGHLFYDQIGKLSARGITLGCGGGNFCPDSSVTREQMAAFIIRALGEFNPPQPASQRFSDVPASSLFYSFIEQMAVRQITVGCGSGNYCPTSVVTREQMAAFIIRALHEAGYVPPAPAGQRFLDVPLSSTFANHIEEMAVRGITVGCGGGNYCPQAAVTRGQMAAFLVRAFGL